MHDASFGLCQMTNKGPDVDDSTSKAMQYSRQIYVFCLFSILSYKGGLHPYKESRLSYHAMGHFLHYDVSSLEHPNCRIGYAFYVKVTATTGSSVCLERDRLGRGGSFDWNLHSPFKMLLHPPQLEIKEFGGHRKLFSDLKSQKLNQALCQSKHQTYLLIPAPRQSWQSC